MAAKSKNPIKVIETPLYQCTACDKAINTTYQANLHPLIDVLVCRKCYKTYGTGDFAADFKDGVDENGDDNYCRWCIDGGDLFGCMNEEGGERCHYSFCKDCISKNVPDDPILNIEEEPSIHWVCYACDKTKLSKLHKEALAAMEDLNKGLSRSSQKTSKASLKISLPQQTPQPVPQPASKPITPTPTKSSSRLKSPQPSVAQASSQSSVKPTKAQPKGISIVQAKGSPLILKPKSQQVSQTPSLKNSQSNAQPQSAPKTPQSQTQPAAARPQSTPQTTSQSAAKSQPPRSQPQSQAAAKPQSTPQPSTQPASQSKPQSEPQPQTNSVPKPQSQGQSTTQPPAQSTPVPSPKPTSLSKTLQQSGLQVLSAGQAKINGSTKSLSWNKDRTSITSVNSKPVSSIRGIKRPLTAADLDQRMIIFGKTKDCCVEEINSKFETIREMLTSKDPKKKRIDMEIETLKKPFIDLQTLFNDLKKLNNYN